jgi:DMSO/TMAO reductase YedYZ molybdopterin-dependent catalytic subunit
VVRDGRDALVVVGMNGRPLPAVNGFPVRLVIAGLYGYVSATKWLSEVELATWDAYDAYWVRRGWSKGPIKTQSRIDAPRNRARLVAGPVTVAGVAWGGGRGIERVEVRVDGGPFEAARLGARFADAAWRQWVYDWRAEPGEHLVSVRATDGQAAGRSPGTRPRCPTARPATT